MSVQTRRRFGQALAALAVAGVSACAPKEGPLVVWAMGVEGETLSGMAAGFMGQDVRVQALPWAAAHEKLLTAFAADDLPDIVALGNTWVTEFAALGALEPLDAMLRMSALDLGHMFDAARQSVTLDGRVVGIPWYVDTRLLFYRKDLLDKAGFDAVATTWDSWSRQLEALSGPNRDGKYSLLMPFAEYEPLVALCLQAEEPILLDNGTRGGFQQPGLRDAFALRRFAVSEWLCSPYHPFRGHRSLLGLCPRRLCLLYHRTVEPRPSSPGVCRRLCRTNGARPFCPGPKGVGASSAGGASMCIPRLSRNKDRAFRFIEHICAERQQASFYTATGDLRPIRPSGRMSA